MKSASDSVRTFSDHCLPTCYLFHSHVITFHTVYINSLAQCLVTQKLQTDKQANENTGLFHTHRLPRHMSEPYPQLPVNPLSFAFLSSVGLQRSILLKLHYYINILFFLASHLFSPFPPTSTSWRLSNFHFQPSLITQLEKIPVTADGRCLRLCEPQSLSGAQPLCINQWTHLYVFQNNFYILEFELHMPKNNVFYIFLNPLKPQK